MLFFVSFFSFCSIKGFVFKSLSNREITESAESTKFKGQFLLAVITFERGSLKDWLTCIFFIKNHSKLHLNLLCTSVQKGSCYYPNVIVILNQVLEFK